MGKFNEYFCHNTVEQSKCEMESNSRLVSSRWKFNIDHVLMKNRKNDETRSSGYRKGIS